MNWRRSIVTAGGLGLLRPAPGTWGSLPPAVLIGCMTPWSPAAAYATLGVLLVAGSVASVVLASWYATDFGREDPGEVVCDEVAGMSLCLLLLPWGDASPLGVWGLAGLGWAAFRVFDILKPPPIGLSQALPGGWGVLVDDLLAGMAAAAVCWSILLLLG